MAFYSKSTAPPSTTTPTPTTTPTTTTTTTEASNSQSDTSPVSTDQPANNPNTNVDNSPMNSPSSNSNTTPTSSPTPSSSKWMMSVTTYVDSKKQIFRISLDPASTFLELLQQTVSRLSGKTAKKVGCEDLSIFVALEDGEEAELDLEQVIMENIQPEEKNRIVVRMKE